MLLLALDELALLAVGGVLADRVPVRRLRIVARVATDSPDTKPVPDDRARNC